MPIPRMMPEFRTTRFKPSPSMPIAIPVNSLLWHTRILTEENGSPDRFLPLALPVICRMMLLMETQNAHVKTSRPLSQSCQTSSSQMSRLASPMGWINLNFDLWFQITAGVSRLHVCTVVVVILDLQLRLQSGVRRVSETNRTRKFSRNLTIKVVVATLRITSAPIVDSVITARDCAAASRDAQASHATSRPSTSKRKKKHLKCFFVLFLE